MSSRMAKPSEILCTGARVGAVAGILLGACGLASAPAQAEFNLNWQADTADPVFPRTFVAELEGEDGEFSSVTVTDGIIQDPTDRGVTILLPSTPFIYERVTQNGQSYYHMVIGDPETGFAQEVYIQTTGVSEQGTHTEGRTCIRADDCGPEEFFVDLVGNGIGPDTSASFGKGVISQDPDGNNVNPLDREAVLSGNASGNPTMVQMRQLIVDGDLRMDFVKDRFLEKPTITNVIEDATFRSTFIMDSAGNNYASLTPSAITNTVEHLGPNPPPAGRPPGGGPSSASFDMATDTQDSVVTGGAYRYIPSPPGGRTDPPLGSNGTYEYAEGGFHNPAPDWASFFDHREENLWGYPEARPTPP